MVVQYLILQGPTISPLLPVHPLVQSTSLLLPQSLAQVSPGCRAEGNGSSGFQAYDGGHLVAQGSLVSLSNNDGFAAGGKGSHLITGDNCAARDNQEYGFKAAEGGQLLAGAGCTHNGNGEGGLLAEDDEEGSCLVWPEPPAVQADAGSPHTEATN
jgi:hypothetical protein